MFEASLTFQTPTAFWSLPLLYLHTRPTHHTAMLFQSCKNIFSYVASQVQPYIPAPLQNILPSLGFSSHQQLEQARRYACGILTSMSLDEDHWQVVDFVALRWMLGCPDENSFWLCAEEICSRPAFFLGDPASDRKLFEAPRFEEVYGTTGTLSTEDLDHFWEVYLARVSLLARRLDSDDTLYIVLCGHGSPRGCLLIGDDYDFVEAWPSSLASAVIGCKANIHVITLACNSDNWASPYWRLLSLAPEDRVSIAIAQSGPSSGGLPFLADHTSLMPTTSHLKPQMRLLDNKTLPPSRDTSQHLFPALLSLFGFRYVLPHFQL